MIVLKNTNNISDELKATIPVLKEGEVRFFKMLTGIENNDPDPIERAKQPIFYAAVQIPTHDRIKDPFTGKFVDIGVVKEFDTATERPISFKTFVPGHGIGQFTLTGGNVDDEELFEYLWLTNYNGKNPNRAKNVEALFEEISYVDEDAQISLEVDLLTEALVAVQSMDVKTKRAVAQKLKLGNFTDDNLLSIKIKEFAKNQPEKFVEAIGKKKAKQAVTA